MIWTDLDSDTVAQVHTGYDEEWPNTSGRPDLSNAVNIVWIVWVVVRLLYFHLYIPHG